LDRPQYLNWIVKEDGVVFEDQQPLNCYRLSYEIDEDILSDWALHIRRHYVPDDELEEDAFLNELTVEEYLLHCARLRWVPDNELKSAVEEVLARCGITHFRKRLIKNLSGGYQQRVGIAQAIVHKPALVVFDEPTNGLDPNQIMEIRHLIKDIAQDRTVILSTHILTEVQAVCDHIMMIEEGKLVFMGSVDEFDNYIIPNTLYLSMVDPPATEELAKIEGVLGVEELGSMKFRIRFTEAQEVIDRIVKESAAKDWRLSEIRVEKSSLDSIFAELSKKAH